MSRRVRILTKNEQAAIWYAQGRYPMSFTAADLATYLGITHRGAARMLNSLSSPGRNFLQGGGGTYNWKKAGLAQP